MIRVAGGETYKDRIELNNTNYSLDELELKLVCNDSKPAVLAPTGAAPVLKLTQMKNFTLEGFELSAKGMRTAIELNGDCYGLHLKNLRISGFTAAGIAAQDLSGFVGQVIRLERLQFTSAASNAVGIRFSGDTTRVQIAAGRFLGPMNAGVRFIANSKTLTEIEITQSIFHQLDDGIQFNGPVNLSRVKIANNTFHASKNGIVFSQMPNSESKELVMSYNLFSEVETADAIVSNGYNEANFRKFLPVEGSGIIGNVSDRKPANPKGIKFFHTHRSGNGLGRTFKFVSLKPADPRFLLPRNGSSKAGATEPLSP
ncbi:MAG: hypothetical protein IID45_04735 [Planctomycetes bacterium]|nr:hypothetical protein [Planctomycetota bacterium]